jgi:hypothetical protein
MALTADSAGAKIFLQLLWIPGSLPDRPPDVCPRCSADLQQVSDAGAMEHAGDRCRVDQESQESSL